MWLANQTIAALRPLRFRGKNRLLGWLLPEAGIRQAQVFGYRVELDLSDFIQRMVYLGTYERLETGLITRYLRPGMTVVDVGANIGYYTLLAARRVGTSGRVFAFEPSPYAADRLEQAVRDNQLTQVRVHRSALGARRGAAQLAIPLPGNHTPSMLGLGGQEGVAVAMTTLDECLADWNVGTVDLLKIDVEGYEPHVLAGACQALAEGRIRAILCEFNDYWLRQAGTDAATLYDSLLRQGFIDGSGPALSLADGVCTRLLVERG